MFILNKSLHSKIVITILPIFAITIGIHFITQIIQTRNQFQEEFDKTIINSMSLLSPALSSNLNNIEKQGTSTSSKGFFLINLLEKL